MELYKTNRAWHRNQSVPEENCPCKEDVLRICSRIGWHVGKDAYAAARCRKVPISVPTVENEAATLEMLIPTRSRIVNVDESTNKRDIPLFRDIQSVVQGCNSHGPSGLHCDACTCA